MSKPKPLKKPTETAQQVEQLLQDVHVLNYKKKSASYEAKRAERLIAEIDHLHTRSHEKLSQSQISQTPTTSPISENLSLRIGRLEREQQHALQQIQKLIDAKLKLELAHLHSETKATEKQQLETKKLKARLVNLIEEREQEYMKLHKEVRAIQNNNKQETDLLTTQRDMARAVVEEHKIHLQEQQRAAPNLPIGYKWLVTLSIAVLLLVSVIMIRIVFLYFHPPTAQQAHSTDKPAKPEPNTTKKASESTPTEAEIKPLNLVHFRDTLRLNGKGPEMIQIPKGRFNMGSPRIFHAEYPQIDIQMDSYAISAYEISFADYLLFTQATNKEEPSDEDWGKNQQPVINLNWHDADAYTTWLSDQTGHHYRLPSEREWEYAAKASSESRYGWGNSLGKNRANCIGCGSPWDGLHPAPIGSFAPNLYGLHDMVGNVMEWTYSCYHANYKNAPTTGNLWHDGDCTQRIVRGGSFSSYKKELRLSKRTAFNPNARSNHLGFRVVRLD